MSNDKKSTGFLDKVFSKHQDNVQKKANKKRVKDLFEEYATKLKVYNPDAKFSIEKYIYAEINLENNTMFVSAQDDLDKVKMLYDKKSKQTYKIEAIDSKEFPKDFSVANVSFSVVGYIVKFSIV